MALSKLAPKNGSITVAGVGGDFSSFSLRARQQVDDTTGYTETTFADHSGSGCFSWTLSFAGFCTKGAAGTTLGMASISDASAAVVCTLDTGCTYSGNFVIEELGFDHRKVAGAVPFSGVAYNKLTIAEAWVTS